MAAGERCERGGNRAAQLVRPEEGDDEEEVEYAARHREEDIHEGTVPAVVDER